MACVVHHKQLVGFAGDGLQQAGHLAVGDVARLPAFVGQQRLHTAAAGRVVVARAVARVVNEHTVAALHFVAQVFECFANVGASGLLVLQIRNVALGYLHGTGHLGRRCAVYARTGQRRRCRVKVAADANDEGMAIDTRRQAAHAQCQHSVTTGLAATGHAGRCRRTRGQVDAAGPHPTRDFASSCFMQHLCPTAFNRNNVQCCTCWQ